jgi:hypothetical protein
MSPISEAIVYASTGPILRDRQEEWDRGVVGAESAEVALTGVDLRPQLIDHPQARGKRLRPRLRRGKPGEQLAAGHPEQVRDRHWVTEGHQGRVDPVLQGGPVVVLTAAL